MSFTADLATWLANVHADITIKTTPNSITPVNVGGDSATLHGLEGLNNLLTQLLGLITSAGDLQAVLNSGNVGDNTSSGINTIQLLQSATDSGQLLLEPSNVAIFNTSGSQVLIFDNTGKIRMHKPATAIDSIISIGPVTATRNIITPDEGNGVGLASTIVLHTTKDNISVINGATNSAILDNAGRLFLINGGGNSATVNGNGQIDLVSGNVQIQMNSGGISIQNVTAGVAQTIALSDNNIQFDYVNGSTIMACNDNFPTAPASVTTLLTWVRPLRSGTYQLSGDGINPTIAIQTGAGIGATATFSTTSDDRSGTITFVVGTSAGTGSLLVINFSQAYLVKTRVLIQSVDTAIPNVTSNLLLTTSESDVNFKINGSPVSGHTYIITYSVAD